MDKSWDAVLLCTFCDICNGQIQYKESLGQGTTIPDLPEVKRVRETQKNISLVEKIHCSAPPPHYYPSYISPLKKKNIYIFLSSSAGFSSSILTTFHKSFLFTRSDSKLDLEKWFSLIFMSAFDVSSSPEPMTNLPWIVLPPYVTVLCCLVQSIITKMEWDKAHQCQRPQRWRESNAISKTLARYLTAVALWFPSLYLHPSAPYRTLHLLHNLRCNNSPPEPPPVHLDPESWLIKPSLWYTQLYIY